MAQVNVDLSEYDMLRQSKDKAEKEVTELKEEVKKLKDNASNVVVRNRYYTPMLDYPAAANRIISNLGMTGVEWMLRMAQDYNKSRMNSPYGMSGTVNPDGIRQLAQIIQHSLSDMLNMRASYREDTTTTEIRGFDEFSETIKSKLELEYRDTFERKKAELDAAKEEYNAKHLDIDKAVERAEETLNKRHEKELKKSEEKIDELEEKVKELKEQLKEASKTSDEKLAEALAKLHAAEAEVAKYSKPVERKRFLGIF